MFSAAAPLVVRADQKRELELLVRNGNSPQKVALRCRLVLLAQQGVANQSIAEQLNVSRPTVLALRAAFAKDGMAAVRGIRRRKRSPRVLTPELEQKILDATLKTRPGDGSTHWSVRTLAHHMGVSRTIVHRVWQRHDVQPHRVERFKLSKDPQFEEKVRDIVGLYLHPPDKSMVLCVAEKSQIQALDRTQPMLPMGLGYVEGVTHDYVRHGTTTLFAALDIATEQVLTACKRRHRHQDYLAFLQHVEENVPRKLDIHLVVDNYATHKHPRVKRWLATHSRYHVHYTPTYASWLNQVEIWFNIITQRAIRRGTFRSVNDLVAKIDHYVQQYNSHTTPFVWTATADSILQKVERLCQRISETQH